MIISIDPGVHEAGVAVWDCDGNLFEACLVRAADPYMTPWLVIAHEIAERVCSRDYAIDVVAIERPQVYVHSRAKGDPNDLITLALAAGATAAAIRARRSVMVVEFRPAEWKGQVPKDVMVRRVKNSLTDEEHSRVEIPKARSLAHNVWDAIGIGLHYLRTIRGKRGIHSNVQ